MGRPWIIAFAVAMASSASAQTTTTTDCTSSGATTRCESRSSRPLDYGSTLEAGRNAVPDLREQRETQLRIQQLELQNRLLERQATVAAAPGFNPKQCRNAAKSALANNDLVLARDVLNACVPEN